MEIIWSVIINYSLAFDSLINLQAGKPMEFPVNIWFLWILNLNYLNVYPNNNQSGKCVRGIFRKYSIFFFLCTVLDSLGCSNWLNPC